MKKIKVLDFETVNKIAAGEVVERPASAVKEMVENSIDAGATSITVEIKNGGISFIRVTDNGSGIASEDAEAAFLPHATSKLREISDLDDLLTMGFRGEALASIAAVSKLTLLSKTKESEFGTAVEVEGGKILSKSEAGCPDGTTIVVEDLFYNTPARMHFLKKDSAEAAHVSEVMQRLALGYPGIAFRLISGGRDVLQTSGNGSLKDVLGAIWGRELASKTAEIDFEKDGVRVTGFAGLPEISRNNRTMQNFFVNGRWVKSKEMQYAAEAGYKTMLMQGKRPVLVISVSLPPMMTDVNVHPQKMEIKFANEKAVTTAIFWGVQNALLASPKAREVEEKEAKVTSTFKKEAPEKPKTEIKKTYEHKPETESKGEYFDFFSEESEALFTAPEMDLESENRQSGVMEETAVSFFDEPEKKQDFEQSVQETADIEIEETVSDFKVKGQIFDTYIIIEKDDEMWLLDQHAAHERLRYEEMIKDKCIFGQLLMVPEIITLSPLDGELLKENTEAFEKLGFSIEEFGSGSFAVRQMPDDITFDTLENTVISVLELIRENKNPEDILDKAFFMIACKGAIKANRPLSQKEAEELTKAVMENEKIRTCPHGRPLFISFTKKFIEKEFKRIV